MYYDEIDPIGQEQDHCKNCGAPTNNAYCSTQCKHEDNFN